MRSPRGSGSGLIEQRRIRGDDDLAMHAGVLQHALRALLAHRDHRGLLERVAHRGLRLRIVERAGADRVDHHRDALLVREDHLAQVSARIGVVKDAAAAEDQQVELLDLRRDLGARELAHRHRALDLVAALGIVGVAREHGDFDLRQVLAELAR